MARSGAARFDRVFDLAMALLAWLVALLVVGMIGWIVADLLRQGLPQLSWTFLLELPGNAGRSGGIRPILISTLLILGVCLAVSVPIGLATAVFLAEFQRGHRGFGRLVRYSLDTLAGVPSIVFGLFGNAFFSISLGLGFSSSAQPLGESRTRLNQYSVDSPTNLSSSRGRVAGHRRASRPMELTLHFD